MVEFAESINAFLPFRKYKILEETGHISKTQEADKARIEYNIFNKNQPIDSDFDKVNKGLLKKPK